MEMEENILNGFKMENLNGEKKYEGKRFNIGKTKYHLIPAFAQEEYAKVLTAGAEKYGDHNWQKGMSWSNVLSSLERHLYAIKNGEDYDKETGLLHSAHIMCNAAFLTEYYKIFPQGDDRRHQYLNTPVIAIDIDDVICDFIEGWKEKFNITDVPSSWFFDRQIRERFEEMKSNNELDEFYLSLKPKMEPLEIPFEPSAYITSRPVATEITEKWLDMHGFPAAPVYTVGVDGSKVEIAKKIGVEVFVDDRFENFVELNKTGITTYLFDASHNQRYNVGNKRIKSLKDLPFLS